jgi:endoglycosylceramidase
MILDPDIPAALDNLRNRDAFRALVRPFPVAVNGTPATLTFDPTTATFDFDYATTRTDGRPSAPALLMAVTVPSLRYPNGYSVSVQGARVVSLPCASTLLLRNDAHAASVSIHLTPSLGC